MQPDFTNISYLKNGNATQRAAYDVLTQHSLLDQLKQFDPVLVGTIPIEIDIDNSDLDIICCFHNQAEFESVLRTAFGDRSHFYLYTITHQDRSSVVANFHIGDFEIEVFGQNVPTLQQAAYRHMLIEYQLLKKHDRQFRQQLIALKQKGYKTEPAFALLLGLAGDPYEALLELMDNWIVDNG